MSTHAGPPRSRENWKIGCKVYVGNLSEGASKADIEGAFSKYGALRNCWVARNPPGFAFVEFEDSRDAEDACRHLDGTRIAGGRIKAEMSHGRTRRGRAGGPPSFGRGPPAPYPYGGIGRGGYAGGPRAGPYNGHSDHPYGNHHGGPRGGYPSHGGHHGGAGAGAAGGYIDRAGRYPPPPPRGSIGSKEYRHYSRSRSNSLGKSPPPPPRAAARPRTPPSRTPSPERH